MRPGAKTVKLAVEGSQAAEQQAIVAAALQTGRVRRVVWVVDHLAFRDSRLSPWAKPGAAVTRGLPRHLYEPSLATVGRYLLSLDTLALSADALLGRGHHDLETLNRWGESARYGPGQVATSFDRMRRVVAREKARPGNDFSPTAKRTRAKVRHFLAPLVEAHPDVRFDFVFAPYSVAAYAVDHLVSGHEFEERLAFKRSVVEIVGGAANVRVFDFQTEAALTHDFARYKDTHHFEPGVNDWMVRAMQAGTHRIDGSSVDAALARHRAQVRAFIEAACKGERPRRYCVPRSPRGGG